MTLPERIGKYSVERLIGRGGMSVVYQGRDLEIQRSVAIKVIEKKLLEERERNIILARFKYEAQAAGRLIHPHIVTIFDYGEDDDNAFIAMELIQGDSVHELLLRDPQPELARVRDVLMPLLDALEYSHDHGVIHRDIKPSNILIGENDKIKVTDFGIARIESSALTQYGLVVGTPFYMSPEQCMGEDTDTRTDIYSAGVIAYELLTGRRPFPGKGSNASVMRDVLDNVPPNPTEYNPGLTGQMDYVIQKALAKKPDDRYQTAREFAEDFRLAIEDALRTGSRVAPAATSMDLLPQSAISPDMLSMARRLRLPGTDGAEAAPPSASPSAPAAAPTRIPPAPRPDPADPEIPEREKARILFVDDEERILTALKSIFRNKYHVFTATSGDQAFEFLKRFRVHLVVSDQRMPGMLGVELLRRAKELSPTTVRILLTGYSDLASIVGSINEGEVYRFINKPWNNQDIQAIVADAVSIGLELADTSVSAAVPEKMDEAILVVDPSASYQRVVSEFFGDAYTVLQVPSLADALTTMQTRAVAVIVADIGAAPGDDTAAFKLLKQEHPEILTIVLTDASDSELVIELINQAQIFRFVNKPVNYGVLKAHIQAALAKFIAFKQAPQLVKQHQVSGAENLRTSNIGRALLGKIKRLRSFLPVFK